MLFEKNTFCLSFDRKMPLLSVKMRESLLFFYTKCLSSEHRYNLIFPHAKSFRLSALVLKIIFGKISYSVCLVKISLTI